MKYKAANRIFKTNKEISEAIVKVKALFSNQLPEFVFNLSVENGLDNVLKVNNLPEYSSKWDRVEHQYKQVFTIMRHEDSGIEIATFTFNELRSVLVEFDMVKSFRSRDGLLYQARIENETVFTRNDYIIYYETQEQFEQLKKEIKEEN